MSIKLKWFVTLVSAFIVLNAQSKDIRLNSKPKEAIIFTRGAQVKHIAKSYISKGNHKLIINDISRHADDKSFVVKGKGSGSLQVLFVSSSVQKDSINYPKPGLETLEQKAIRRRIDVIKDSLNHKNTIKNNYNKEQKFLDDFKNQYIFNNKKDSLSILFEEGEDWYDFYVDKWSMLSNKLYKVNREIGRMNTLIATLRNELKDLQQGNTWKGKKKPPVYTSHLEIQVNCEKSGDFVIEVSYFTNKARWQPIYDFNVEVDKPVELIHKAKFYQNTEFDWENIKLSFSTSQPRRSKSAPVFRPLIISANSSYRNNYYKEKKYAVKNLSAGSEDIEENVMEMPVANQVNSMSYQSVKTINLSNTPAKKQTAGFQRDLNGLYTLKSTTKQSYANIKKDRIEVQYEYLVMPSRDPHAYLMVTIPNWSDYKIVSGAVNLYFNETYVGKTNINTSNVSDTLMVSLGIDDNIKVKREKIKDDKEEKLVGDNIVKTQIWAFTIKNNRNHEVLVRLIESLPVSKTKEVKMNYKSLDGASFDKEKGKLEWFIKMKPGQKKEKKIKFEVTYPPKKYRINF